MKPFEHLSPDNAILDYFDRLYVINLETRQDRLIELQHEFEKVGLDFSHPKIQVFKAIRPTEVEDWPTLGTKGCYLSHLAVLKDAKQHGYERILILEDDAKFSNYFSILANATLTQLKATDWDIFYGGYGVRSEAKSAIDNAFRQQQFVDKNLYAPPTTTEVYCLHCVALKKATIAAMVDYFDAIMHRPNGDSNGGRMHIDGAYCWFRREHPQTKTLLAFPELATQRSSRTDIHQLKWFDSLPFFKTATSTARRIKNYLI